MKYAIAQMLRNAMPGYVSGGELARNFNVSRTAVWKCIEELRGEGYPIEASSRKGYRMLPSTDRFNAFEIADGLNTFLVGSSIQYFHTTDSTNNCARRFAADGCADGLTVIAEEQTAGKGRLGRSWESPSDKGIYMSVVLRPALAPVETQILTLAAAVAVSNAIRRETGLEAGIKWPNDLVLDGRKVCGILLEMSSEADRVNYIVLGIGINYDQEEGDFPQELRHRAISLKMASRQRMQDVLQSAKDTGINEEVPQEAQEKSSGAGTSPGTGYSKLSLVRTLLRELDSVLQLVYADEHSRVLDMWRKSSATLGRKVGFMLKNTEYTGTAVDIAPDGRLVVDCSDGVRRELLSGEVSVSGIYRE